MRLLSFSQFLLFVLLVSLSSCEWLKTDAKVASNNPNFISLTFKFDKSNPGISRGKFTVEKDPEFTDSIIVNLDSLPFNTRLDSIVPIFEFYSTSATNLYVTKENKEIDNLLISESTKPDTIDFRWEVKIHNKSADKEHEVNYVVKINVHTVEPKLYVWKRVVASLYDFSASSQKALSFNDSIYFFVSSGFNNSLFKSKDGYTWSDKISISELPISAVTRNIVKFKNTLYYAHRDENLYMSTNGLNWTKKSFVAENYEIVNLLFELNNKLWAISKSKLDSKYHFAFSEDALNWSISSEIPKNFPIGDYAAHSFASRTNKSKAIVIGGYDSSEKLLKNIWSTENGTYWIDFSTENSNLNSLAGASIISYDNKLLMYGLMKDDGSLADNWYVESVDEGLSWQKSDTEYNKMTQMQITQTGTKLDTTYIKMQPRYLTSVLTDKEKRIIMIGGRDRTSFFNDVWVGKLNRLNFDRQ